MLTLCIGVFRKYFLTISVHLHLQTFPEPTGLALVSSSNIYHAVSVFLADVLQTTTDAPLEKSPTAVTALHAIMFPRSLVSADKTQDFRFSILLSRILIKKAQYLVIQISKFIMWGIRHSIVDWFWSWLNYSLEQNEKRPIEGDGFE